MILSKNRILEEIEKKSILIEPFDKKCLGPNSYDIHLGRYLAVYNSHTLDSKEENVIEEITIPTDGYTLYPGKIYLGVTEEYTETLQHIPFLEGISSVARLGINVNPSSGKGNIGHCNTWTLDINVVQPVTVYPGMPIAQLFFFKTEGKTEEGYNKMKNAKYSSRSLKPVASKMWKNDW